MPETRSAKAAVCIKPEVLVSLLWGDPGCQHTALRELGALISACWEQGLQVTLLQQRAVSAPSSSMEPYCRGPRKPCWLESAASMLLVSVQQYPLGSVVSEVTQCSVRGHSPGGEGDEQCSLGGVVSEGTHGAGGGEDEQCPQEVQCLWAPPLGSRGASWKAVTPPPSAAVSSHSIPSLPGWHSPFRLGSPRGRAREVV